MRRTIACLDGLSEVISAMSSVHAAVEGCLAEVLGRIWHCQIPKTRDQTCQTPGLRPVAGWLPSAKTLEWEGSPLAVFWA